MEPQIVDEAILLDEKAYRRMMAYFANPNNPGAIASPLRTPPPIPRAQRRQKPPRAPRRVRHHGRTTEPQR